MIKNYVDVAKIESYEPGLRIVRGAFCEVFGFDMGRKNKSKQSAMSLNFSCGSYDKFDRPGSIFTDESV